MRVNRIVEKTFAEGPGCRLCIWVQGCNHRCSGCFAVDLWDFDGGCEISTDEIKRKISAVSQEICGITLLGGEPFEYSPELSEIAAFAHSLNKSVISFSGYTYEYLKSNNYELLHHTDLLIDDKFEKSLVDFSRPLAGSSNQRFIYLTSRITEQEIKSYKNRFEVRLDKSGKIQFNGMGNIEELKKYLSGVGEN